MAAESQHPYNTRLHPQEDDVREDADRGEGRDRPQDQDRREDEGSTSGKSSEESTSQQSASHVSLASNLHVPHQTSTSNAHHLVALGKELGLSGKDLVEFVKEEREQERQREEHERQREERERQREERERDRKFELERLRIQAQASNNANNNARQNAQPDFDSRFVPKIPYLDDNDDIEGWFHQYECYARDLKLDDQAKATRLVYYLKGKARAIHAKMDDEDAHDYETIKSALFEGFQLTAEQYRTKFRAMRKDGKDSYKEFVTKAERCLKKWIELDGCQRDVDGLTDLMLREQVLQVMPVELAVHVKDRKPRSAKEIGQIATEYEQNRSNLKGPPLRPKHPGNKNAGNKSDSDDPPKNALGKLPPPSKEEKEKLKATGCCYICRVKGHMASTCPDAPKKKGTCLAIGDRTNLAEQPADLNQLCTDCKEKKFPESVYVRVNGEKVVAMRDSGCNSIVVASRLIRDDQYIEGSKKIYLADKKMSKNCPLAIVHIDSPYFCCETEVVAMDNPIYDVLIGKHFGTNGNKVKTPMFPIREPSWYGEPTEPQCAAVTTRAEARREEADSAPEDERKKKKKIKEPSILGVESREEFITAQQQDPSLEKLRESADKGEIKGGKKMIYRNGILYQSSLDKRGEETLRAVIPKSLRNKVMTYGHEHPMAGHLGQKRTEERIRREFWWPACSVDIKRHCLSCDACQRTAPKHLTKKVPIGKMPIFDTAFKRVAVDIIGPITPMAESKHQYILTMIDYATRYPEAVPLKNIKAETVADALWNFWTRLGVPESVLSDNGSQFTCELMKEVERLLKIKHKVCAVFHPSGNGLCERMNGCLKSMLRKLCIDQPKKWDTFIPALLFAYRETPQDSLGFSPFELLYGRTVRGPMQILRQIWTEDDVSDDERTTAEYVINLRNKMEETCKLASENLGKAAKRQARYYNRKAKPRSLAEGTQVLILLPSKSNKLEMTWQGPYVVENKLNDYDYRVKSGSKAKIYHINLLKEYVSRDQFCNTANVAVLEELIGADDEEETVAVVIEEDETMREASHDLDHQKHVPTLQTKRTETIADIHFCEKLAKNQLEEAKAVCQEYEKNLSDVPLTTNLTTCQIKLSTDQPVYVRPRPIPHALVKNVEDEVEEMQKLGVIEPACSPYNSPIVMVKKKSGEYRFCADLRALNDVTVFDGEPLTDVEHLFQSLGKAKYFSKLDLTKGYWAIPIDEEDRDKTAFTTSKGQFRWVNLPFGLKTASGIFNRFMRKLLGPLHRQDVHHFMDDILIATETWEEHMEALRAVLGRLAEANIAAKPSKVYIGYDQLPFLGHEIGAGQRWPETEKIEKIVDAPYPSTKKQLRSFLGLCSFYREYIPSFSTLSAPLTDLTKKNVPEKITWNAEAERSFIEMKTRISQRPVLRMPDHEKDYVLRTDASDRGLGAVLLQEHEGKLHPVAFQSKKLQGAEARYATVEKECLATVWAVQKFERFLYGRKFILETDHQPLKCLQKTPTNPRLIRWALQLQPYEYNIRVIPGRDNVGADFMSRAY